MQSLHRHPTFAIALVLAVALLLATTPHASAQYGTDVVLNPLVQWERLGSNGTDWLTRVHGESGSGTSFGLSYYVPHNGAQPYTHALYRLYHPGPDEHMDSAVLGEGGYSHDGDLGFPWDSQLSGLLSLDRWYNPANNDHFTTGHAPPPPGYAYEGVLGWGFPRYGESPPSPSHTPYYSTIDAMGVSIAFDRVWGAAASKISWNNWHRYINNDNTGLLLQSDVRWSSNGNVPNPTEAGDQYNYGSPVLGEAMGGGSYVATTLPLHFESGAVGGGVHNPVLWGGTITKAVDILDVPLTAPYRFVCWTVTFSAPEGFSQRGDGLYEWLTDYTYTDMPEVLEWNNSRGTIVHRGHVTSDDWYPPMPYAWFLARSNLSRAIGLYSWDVPRVVTEDRGAWGTYQIALTEPGGQVGGGPQTRVMMVVLADMSPHNWPVIEAALSGAAETQCNQTQW